MILVLYCHISKFETTVKVIMPSSTLKNVKFQDGSSDDEEDWIQVSEEENVDDDGEMLENIRELSFRKRRPSLSVHHVPRKNYENTSNSPKKEEESFRLTQSGSIWIHGFDGIITTKGIGIASNHNSNGGKNAKTSSQSINASSELSMQDRLVILGKLGRGVSGTVYKAIDLLNFNLIAIKFISTLEKRKRRQMVQELCAFHRTNINYKPSNLVSFLDAFHHIPDDSVGIVMEYMDFGSLQDYFVEKGGCQEEKILSSIAKQCLLGLRSLHSQHQIHRDIKPSNILHNSKGEVKLGDFGISRFLPISLSKDIQLDTTAAAVSAETFVGTLTYMSPERINSENYGYASDIWSLGLSMITIATGEHPMESKSFWSVWGCLQGNKSPSLPNEDSKHHHSLWSDDFCDFVNQCLIKDPENRPDCDALLCHSFVSSASLLLPWKDHPKNDEHNNKNVEKTETFDQFDIGISILESIQSHIVKLLENEIVLHRQNDGSLVYKEKGPNDDVSVWWKSVVWNTKMLTNLATQLNMETSVLSKILSRFLKTEE